MTQDTSGHRRENTDKAEDLASWGYVVVGLDTSDTHVSVFPNGTVVYGQTVISHNGAAIDAAIEGRLLDMQFVLDELESLNAGDPRLGGRLDLDKIGVFGWSLGGCNRGPVVSSRPSLQSWRRYGWRSFSKPTC